MVGAPAGRVYHVMCRRGEAACCYFQGGVTVGSIPPLSRPVYHVRRRTRHTPDSLALLSFFHERITPSKRLVRAREGSPHMRHRAVVVSQPFFGLLEMTADNVDEWFH
jgi:hypothetical protein